MYTSLYMISFLSKNLRFFKDLFQIKFHVCGKTLQKVFNVKGSWFLENFNKESNSGSYKLQHFTSL